MAKPFISLLSGSDLKSLVDWPDALIEDYLSLVEQVIKISPKIVEIAKDYQVTNRDSAVVSAGGNTITLPIVSSAGDEVMLYNNGGVDDTIDGNGSSVGGGLTLFAGTYRRLLPYSGGWLDVT